MQVGLADTHCHLADDAFDKDREEVVERALAAGVSHIMAVGGGGPIESSEASADLAAAFPFMRSSAGIHPHDASSYCDDIEARIGGLLERVEVVAVGETGLDYYYDNSPREAQREAFARHLALAVKHDLPVIIHCRDAASDIREVVSAVCPGGLRGVVHCFTGNYEDARWYIDHGLTVSLTGIITFKKADELRATVKKLPLDTLMVETDAPYLAPMPYRGKRNEPAYVAEVAGTLAEVMGLEKERVYEATGANAAALFFDA